MAHLGRVAENYRNTIIAGIVPSELVLPGGLIGRQRVARISLAGIDHVAWRHPRDLIFCLHHMAAVLAAPQYLGHRPGSDHRRVEFVRLVGRKQRELLVAVKFLDDLDEAWVSTAHRTRAEYLTRRLRAGTMQIVRGS